MDEVGWAEGDEVGCVDTLGCPDGAEEDVGDAVGADVTVQGITW